MLFERVQRKGYYGMEAARRDPEVIIHLGYMFGSSLFGKNISLRQGAYHPGPDSRLRWQLKPSREQACSRAWWANSVLRLSFPAQAKSRRTRGTNHSMAQEWPASPLALLTYRSALPLCRTKHPLPRAFVRSSVDLHGVELESFWNACRDK